MIWPSPTRREYTSRAKIIPFPLLGLGDQFQDIDDQGDPAIA